jgi:hypothetical protein
MKRNIADVRHPIDQQYFYGSKWCNIKDDKNSNDILHPD